MPTKIETDVVVIGGGFCGSATALLIKRQQPDAQITIIERKAEFDRKVGESTAEISSCFMTRILGIGTWLGQEQLAKNGLRMWFNKSSEQSMDDCVEIGARDLTKLPGFQIDRSKLDEHLLKLAADAGCEVIRPATVKDIDFAADGGGGRLTYRQKDADADGSLAAKWVVDASGRAATIARKLDILHPLDEHPTNALWGRFKGMRDWDSWELRQKHPKLAAACRANRNWSTNHLLGYGWWCWIIPLKGGDFSVGLVYDKRLYSPPPGDSIAEKIKSVVMEHPVGREMMRDIEVVDNDSRAYSMLPYYSEKLVDQGWSLTGDASGFLDPLYSPGLDYCSYTCSIAASLACDALEGKDISARLDEYNAQFRESYQLWFESLYKDKYYYMGDAELMNTAVLLDIATYYIGPVRLVYANPDEEFLKLPFNGIHGRLAAAFMKQYNRRLSLIAKRRQEHGIYGANNSGWRSILGGFEPDASAVRVIFKAVGSWVKLEIGHAALGLKPLPAHPVTLHPQS